MFRQAVPDVRKVFADLLVGVCRGGMFPSPVVIMTLGKMIVVVIERGLVALRLPTSEPSDAEIPTVGPYCSSEHRTALDEERL